MRIAVFNTFTKKSQVFDTVSEFTEWAIELALSCGLDMVTYVDHYGDDGDEGDLEIIDNATYTADRLPSNYHIHFYRYEVRCRENGDTINRFESRKEAQDAINVYEEDDREQGIYEPNFYSIYEWGLSGSCGQYIQ